MRKKRQGFNLDKVKGITVEGKVVDSFPNAMFKVELGNGNVVMAQVAGKLRKNYIKILPDDKVIVELSEYDLTKGRIIFRDK